MPFIQRRMRTKKSLIRLYGNTFAPFLDLNLSISNDIISVKIYDKRDDFSFDIVNFSFFFVLVMSLVLHFMVYIFLS